MLSTLNIANSVCACLLRFLFTRPFFESSKVYTYCLYHTFSGRLIKATNGAARDFVLSCVFSYAYYVLTGLELEVTGLRDDSHVPLRRMALFDGGEKHNQPLVTCLLHGIARSAPEIGTPRRRRQRLPITCGAFGTKQKRSVRYRYILEKPTTPHISSRYQLRRSVALAVKKC